MQLAALDSLDRLGEVAEPDLARERRRRARTARMARSPASCRRPAPAWDLLALDALLAADGRTSRTCSSRPAAAARTRAISASRRSTRATSSASAAPKRSSTRSSAAIASSASSFFYLWGDTVTLNVKSFTAFCDELIARNLPIHWFGNARADNLTDPAFVHRLQARRLLDARARHRDRVGGRPQGHGQAARAAEDPGRVQEHARRGHQVVRVLHLRLPR